MEKAKRVQRASAKALLHSPKRLANGDAPGSAGVTGAGL